MERISPGPFLAQGTEDPGSLDHRPRELGLTQDDVAARFGEVTPGPVVIQGQRVELEEQPVRRSHGGLDASPPRDLGTIEVAVRWPGPGEPLPFRQ
jgi:hypothetical protein